jgi:DNA end-binding protein Ku
MSSRSGLLFSWRTARRSSALRPLMARSISNSASRRLTASSAIGETGLPFLGLTLRFPYEVRDQAAYFEDIPELKLPKEMLDLATHIVNTKSGHFDPAQFEDRYENALVDLLKKKEAGEKIEPAKAGPAPRVVNLMEALRASIDADKKKAPAPSVQARRPARKASKK